MHAQLFLFERLEDETHSTQLILKKKSPSFKLLETLEVSYLKRKDKSICKHIGVLDLLELIYPFSKPLLVR